MLCLTVKCHRNRSNDPCWCYDLPLLTFHIGADVCISCVLCTYPRPSFRCVQDTHFRIYVWDPKSYSVLSRRQHACGFPFLGCEPFLYYVSSEVYWCLSIGAVYLRTQDKYKPNVTETENQLDATYYFIMLMLGSLDSTCFGHHYAHHQELTTIALVTTQAVWFSRCCWLEVKCRQDGWVSGPRAVTRVNSPRSGHSSILPALNFQPAATREPDGLCGNQRYRREFLMIDIMVPETCWA